jgi:hypothetical protein
MKIIKEFNIGEMVFDNLKDALNSTIELDSGKLIIEFDKIMNTQFSGGNVQADLDSYKSFLNLGKYSKAECGGFPNFYKTESDNGNCYVIYSGVNEVSNSHYIVTVHKIISC